MSATQLALVPVAPAPEPPPVSLEGARVVLRGALAGRLARGKALAAFLQRCRELDQLVSVRFDLAAARIELTFAAARSASPAWLRDWARAVRRGRTDDAADPGALAQRIWEAPVTLWRSGRVLSTWRVRHVGSGRVRLSHRILSDGAISRVVAAQLRQCPVVESVLRRSPSGAYIDLRCDHGAADSVLTLIAAAESIEAALGERIFAKPAAIAGDSLLLNTNLVLAIGAAAFPVLLPASALALLAASVPVLRQTWTGLRERRVDMATALTCLTALALVNNDHLPAALMLWLFRFWERRTMARLRRAETALFARLATRSAPDLGALRSAAVAAADVFAEPPGTEDARAFADASAPYMLCLGAAALFPNGPAVAQAVLRPDFFSSVLVNARLAAADLVLRLADLGCVVRDFRAVQQMRAADALVLDDSVTWERDGLERGAFGRALARLGVEELICFRVEGGMADNEVAALGASRVITRSPAQTRVSYLSQRRFLGHRVMYAGAINTLSGRIEADPIVAVGADFLAEERRAPIGLLQPSLARFLEVLQLVRGADAGERNVKIATVVVNAALVAGAAYAGLSTLAVVTAGTAATACVFAGSRLPPRRAPLSLALPPP
ncbi:MAG: hypothetical protein JOY66_00615 [Acetobacteraceae bacterium]|nr:hypothetical protein [Acetobacteraceae bacterium]